MLTQILEKIVEIFKNKNVQKQFQKTSFDF